MIQFLFLIIICCSSGHTFKLAPGEPVPNSELLDDIITAHVFSNMSAHDKDSIEYITGNTTGEQLDPQELALGALDIEAVSKIATLARRRNYLRQAKKEALRKNLDAYYNGTIISVKFISLMEQSIFGTRERMKKIKKFIKHFQDQHGYKMGQLYGSIMEMKIKLRNIYGTAGTWFHKKNRFLFYIIMYEKALRVHTDINNNMRTMFKLHHEWLDTLKIKKPSG